MTFTADTIGHVAEHNRLLSEGQLSVTTYGAVGDGSTDDTAAINSALADARSQGKFLFFPAGTYKITSALDCTAGGYRLVGSGGSDTKIIQYGTGVPVLKLGGAENYLGFMTLRQDATPSSAGDANRRGENGIELEDFYLSLIENVRITNVAYGICLPDDIDNWAFSCTFRDIDINNVYAGAISMKHQSNSASTGNVWSNIYLNGYTGTRTDPTDYVVHIDNTQESVFNQFNVEGWQGRDLIYLYQTGATFNSLHVESCTLVGTNPRIIRPYYSNTVVINGMTVQGVNFADTGSTGTASVFKTGGNHVQLRVNGLKCIQNTNTAALPLYIYDSDNNTDTNCETSLDGLHTGRDSGPSWTGDVSPTANAVRSIRGVPQVTVSSARKIKSSDQGPVSTFTSVPITLGTNGTKTGTYVNQVTDGLQVTAAGVYLVDAVVWSDATSSTSLRNIGVRVNGTTVREFGVKAAGPQRVAASFVLSLAASDTVDMRIYTEDSDVTVKGTASTKDTGITVTYLGAA